MHFNLKRTVAVAVDPAWYGFGTANQQNMKQVRYLSWLNSRRNYLTSPWENLSQIKVSNKNKLVSSLKPHAWVHISADGSEITFWLTIWPETMPWLWQCIFYLLLNDWLHVLPGIHRMKDYDKKNSRCWKTHLIACRFTRARFQWMKQHTALTSYPTAPISRFCTIIGCAKQGRSLIRDCKISCQRIYTPNTQSWKRRGEKRHTHIVMEKHRRKKITEVIVDSVYEILSLSRGWFLKQLGCTDWKRFIFY